MKKKFIFPIAILIFLLTPLTSLAQDSQFEPDPNVEQILEYNSEVYINEDASLEVVETISVNALGYEIQRGIYRDFPTRYTGKFGENSNTTFDIEEVLMDGQPAPYFTEGMSNGIRLYIGDADVFLPEGEYTYQITYTTERQFTYFDDYDGLFYNFIGTGWAFPVLNSRAEIHIPAKLTDEQIDYGAYWGVQGAENEGSIDIQPEFKENETVIYYYNGNVLQPYEGFSGWVQFPKGIVYEPTAVDIIMNLIIDNIFGILMLLLSFITVIVAFLIWYLRGRDPKGRTPFPQYKIPKDLTPGMARYIDKMGYDTKILTSTIISLGTKGYVVIKENKGGFLKSASFQVVKKTPKKKVGLTPEEKTFLEQYFIGKDSVTFKKSYDSSIKRATDAFESNFKQTYKQYYSSNGGILAAIAVILVVLIGGLLALQIVLNMFSILSIPGIIIMLIAFVVLIPAMKARSKKGREMEDYILGLKMFLMATEEEKIKIMNKEFPKNMETFNKFFPYAMALGVETTWLKQFKNVLEKASLDQQDGMNNYGWYIGYNSLANANFGSNLNNTMSSTIAAASTPPSQSGSGGGFSGGAGGGGGGGGGGGW